MQKLNVRQNIFFFLIGFFLTACGPDYFYQDERIMPESGWEYQDIVTFSFEIMDTSRLCDMILLVDHTTDYPKQNMYVKISTSYPSGTRHEQVLSLEFADKLGNWFGRCNNQYCELYIPIQQKIFFKETGIYKLSLEQFMRENPVTGIRRFGLFIEDIGVH